MPFRLARRWFAFDEARPTAAGLLVRFIAALVVMLLLAGGLAWLTAQ